MKVQTKVHNVVHLDNRSTVTFNVEGHHNELLTLMNKIFRLSREHNAQETIYCNQDSLKYDKKGDVIGLCVGNEGGSITFHAHSCNPKQAAYQLLKLLHSAN